MNTHTPYSPYLTRLSAAIRTILLSLAVWVLWSTAAAPALKAQPLINPRNLSLGGGGTAYLSGFDANFYNPANLAVFDREGTIHLNVGAVAAFFEPVLSADSPLTQYEKFTGVFAPLNPADQQISTQQRLKLLEDNYSGNTLTSEHLGRADFVWGGLKWNKGKKTYSLALRTRIGSRIEVGRGWYSENTLLKGNEIVRDFSLVKQLQVLHEFSFGYGREFEFFNGLVPRINKLYIGFAPKFVIGGAYQNAIYEGRYFSSEDQPVVLYEDRMDYHSSGSISEMTRDYISGTDIRTAQRLALGSDYNVKPTGYGAGFDFGLTYVMPLGSDVSLIKDDEDRRPVQKSLRIGISITDVGLIHYTSDPLLVKRESTISQINSETVAESKFVGAVGQFADYFNRARELRDPLRNNTSNKERAFTALLPTSMNAGAVLDINRAKVMADLTLGLRNTALTNTKLTARLGLETRPAPFLPVRVGTTIAAGKPISLSAGTGIETRYWDLTLSGQILFKSNTLTTDVVGGAVSVLQFHF